MLLAAVLVCAATAARAQTPNAPAKQTQAATVSSTVPPVVEINATLSPATPAAAAKAEGFSLPADQHLWTRFPVGAWREIEITTETFDQDDQITSRSVTTQQERLQAVGADRYSLDLQATVDLVGKRIVGTWTNRELYKLTDRNGQVVETTRLEDEALLMAQGPIICEVWDVLYREEDRAMVERIYYSPAEFPYVLRREIFAAGAADGPGAAEQVDEVVALNVPYDFDGETIRCCCLRTVRRSEKGGSERIALISSLVPGGELAVWTTDFYPGGARSRWSVQQLLNYDEQPVATSQPSRRELRRERRRNR